MSHRFIELVVRARRLGTRDPRPATPGRGRTRVTAPRGGAGELTQFSFRLAFMIDLAYVGIGALGGAALDSAARAPADAPLPSRGCPTDSVVHAPSASLPLR